ncbi:hypothetical protein SISNIDRAFT_502805, partial [Sistotremastrum niveocremeum HHB9708]
IQNVASKTDKTIKDFEGQFEDIKGAFQTLTTENIHAAVIKIRSIQLELLDEVQDLHVQVNLNDMIYPRGANFDPKKACLPDTREHALHVLQKFASGLALHDHQMQRNSSNSSVLWIKGAAGTGKSFIAHRLVQLWQPHGKMGSSFFFNYRTQKDAPPHSLIPKFSQDLASAYPAWKHALNAIIERNRSLRYETSILQQFDSLLIQPTRAVFIPHPILFVIDGLDEAGDREGRSELIEVLTTRFHELPSNFRFVLFSRPERDIADAFASSSHHISLDMKDLCTADDGDIERLVENKFKPLKAKPENAGWLTDGALSHLVLKSGGLMVFAGTACDYIIIPVQGSTFAGRLKHILELEQVPKMDSLYSAILQANIGSDKQATAHFQTVMGRMVSLQEPLSYDAYVALDRHGVHQNATETTLPFMASLLHGVQDRGIPISPIHKSFTDFLIDKDRSVEYHIRKPDHRRLLLRDCLSEMAKNLWFNVCGAETSDNADQDKQRQNISAQLKYACQFWAVHLSDITYDSEIATQLKLLLEQKLLHWLEVLNCIEYSESISALVAHIIRWSQWDDVELAHIGPETEAWLRQSSDFQTTSGPHVYLSTLPYVNPTNWVHRQYRHLFHHLPVVTSELLTDPSSLEKTLFYLVRDGTNIARAQYSPDGAHLCVSNGPLFVLFDSTSYEPIWRHEYPSTTGIRDWHFSPDGSCIYLLGQNLEFEVMQIIDGTCRSSPIKIHPTEDIIHAVISFDCRYVRSVTKQGAILKWCTQTGEHMTPSTLPDFDIFDDHGNVALSPDGMPYIPSIIPQYFHVTMNAQFVLGVSTVDRKNGAPRCMNNMRIPPAASLLLVTISLSQAAQKMALSVYGMQLTDVWFANPFKANMVRRTRWSSLQMESGWSASQLRALRSSRAVFGIQISTDSSLMAVAVGSDVIRIQETKSAKVIARKSLRSRPDTYGVLAFSPENSILAYADDTHCIGLWHWQTPEQDHHLYEGHTAYIRSLCFSPNAELLLSASDDKTIRVWDIRSGTASPFRVIQTNGMSLPINAVPVFVEGRNWIVSADFYDHSIKVSDLDAEESLKQRITWPPDLDIRLALSPNGARLLSASKSGIQLWTMIDGQLSKFGHNLEADHGDVCSAAFSPDSCKVAVGFGDNNIQIWDVETGKKFGAPLHAHCKPHTLAFTPDGTQIMAASRGDGVVHSWDIASEPTPLPWKSKPTDASWVVDDPWDGWVYDTGPDESRLFWVPKRFRPGFVWSVRHRVIGVPQTRVDISDFVHGKDWTKCWKGPTSAISDSAS